MTKAKTVVDLKPKADPEIVKNLRRTKVPKNFHVGVLYSMFVTKYAEQICDNKIEIAKAFKEYKTSIEKPFVSELADFVKTKKIADCVNMHCTESDAHLYNSDNQPVKLPSLDKCFAGLFRIDGTKILRISDSVSRWAPNLKEQESVSFESIEQFNILNSLANSKIMYYNSVGEQGARYEIIKSTLKAANDRFENEIPSFAQRRGRDNISILDYQKSHSLYLCADWSGKAIRFYASLTQCEKKFKPVAKLVEKQNKLLLQIVQEIWQVQKALLGVKTWQELYTVFPEMLSYIPDNAYKNHKAIGTALVVADVAPARKLMQNMIVTETDSEAANSDEQETESKDDKDAA